MAVSTSTKQGSWTQTGAWKQWLSFTGQVALVAALGSADDIIHGLTGQSNVQVAARDASKVVAFEAAHDLWIEPQLQQFFTHAHDFLGLVLGYAQIVPIFNTIYGLGHVGITLAFAIWMYKNRRQLFPFVRNIFLLTNALAILIYELFPLAPPRLAGRLDVHGHSYQFIDTIFSNGNGVRLGFNEFAAMPSLHVGWALIVALTMFWVVRGPLLRMLVLFYPLLMTTTVVVTGNHYIADGLGAAGVLCAATVLALLLEWWQVGGRSPLSVTRRLHSLRYVQAIDEQTYREWSNNAPMGHRTAA